MPDLPGLSEDVTKELVIARCLALAVERDAARDALFAERQQNQILRYEVQSLRACDRHKTIAADVEHLRKERKELLQRLREYQKPPQG